MKRYFSIVVRNGEIEVMKMIGKIEKKLNII